MAKRLVFEEYHNLTAFAKSLERKENTVFARASLHSKENCDSDWAGTRTYEEAVDLFNNGWSEKVEEIRKGLVQFAKANERDVSYQKKRPENSVVGFAPHVPNAILGLPNSMIQTERTPMKVKVVRIIYNMTMNCGTDAEDIMNAGLAVLKIAYSLEMKGYRVRIDVNPFLATKGSENSCCLVCVKDWRQPIDIKKVAFPIAHPAMFRRLGFRWLEVCDIKNSDWTGGYGRSLENLKDAKKVLEDANAIGKNDYFVNVETAKKNKYDPAKTAEAIGIKL